MELVRDAATVMLVRDAPDLQVFLLQRNLDSTWVGGVSVFPGGAVDPEDRSPEAAARAPGRTDASASALLGLKEGGLGFWIAGIRESFEEAGVLLAHRRDGGPVDLDRLDRARAALNAERVGFLDVLDEQDLLLDVAGLHVFSHWITPAGSARRYDTWFFVAAAPDGHAYCHDDGETVASAWIRPSDALARAEAGELALIFPTRRTLEALERFETAAALVEHAALISRAAGTTSPSVVVDANGARIALPGERDARVCAPLGGID